MLVAWEGMIKPSDYVLHLGDVSIWHRSHVRWAEVTKNLPGKKFLILGNHDGQWTEKQWRTVAGFTVTPPFVWTPTNWQASIYFSHEAAAPSGKWEYNVHGHSHNHAPFRRYEKMQTTYYNVSIEGFDYAPIKLGEILNELRS
jgi:calcineurin-like phosphoesterase family protein